MQAAAVRRLLAGSKPPESSADRREVRARSQLQHGPAALRPRVINAGLCSQLSVLRRGRRPGPRVLRGDGGDQEWPEEVQAEEDPEESDSTGEGRRARVCAWFV